MHALSWIPLPPLNKRVGCILRENRIDNTHIRVYRGDIRQSSFVPRTRSMIGHSTSIIYRPAIHIIPARVRTHDSFFIQEAAPPFPSKNLLDVLHNPIHQHLICKGRERNKKLRDAFRTAERRKRCGTRIDQFSRVYDDRIIILFFFFFQKI